MKPLLLARLMVGLAVAVILVGGQHWLLAYAAVLLVSMEALNTRPAYRAIPRHGLLNIVFGAFILLIAVNRSITVRPAPTADAVINWAEHILFALVICLNLWCWARVLLPKARHLVLAVVLAFNAIGLANELFQNSMNGRAWLALDPDARKDLAVNAIGSLLFLALARQRAGK